MSLVCYLLVGSILLLDIDHRHRLDRRCHFCTDHYRHLIISGNHRVFLLEWFMCKMLGIVGIIPRKK